MKNLIWLVVLSGCGSIATKADCLTFKSAAPLDAAALEVNVKLARGILVKIIPDMAFCRALSPLDLSIRQEEGWDRHMDGNKGISITYGETYMKTLDPTGAIELGVAVELGSDVRALAHELIHVWDYQHGINRVDHLHWPKTGRTAADEAFMKALLPIHLEGALPPI